MVVDRVGGEDLAVCVGEDHEVIVAIALGQDVEEPRRLLGHPHDRNVGEGLGVAVALLEQAVDQLAGFDGNALDAKSGRIDQSDLGAGDGEDTDGGQRDDADEQERHQ